MRAALAMIDTEAPKPSLHRIEIAPDLVVTSPGERACDLLTECLLHATRGGAVTTWRLSAALITLVQDGYRHRYGRIPAGAASVTEITQGEPADHSITLDGKTGTLLVDDRDYRLEDIRIAPDRRDWTTWRIHDDGTPFGTARADAEGTRRWTDAGELLLAVHGALFDIAPPGTFQDILADPYLAILIREVLKIADPDHPLCAEMMINVRTLAAVSREILHKGYIRYNRAWTDEAGALFLVPGPDLAELCNGLPGTVRLNGERIARTLAVLQGNDGLRETILSVAEDDLGRKLEGRERPAPLTAHDRIAARAWLRHESAPTP